MYFAQTFILETYLNAHCTTHLEPVVDDPLLLGVSARRPAHQEHPELQVELGVLFYV